MLKILITGAGGFIGRHLIKRLTELNDLEIYIIALDMVEMPKEFKEIKNLKYISADIINGSMLFDLFKAYKPDIVIHLAAILADKCEEDPDICINVNINGFHNILKSSVINNIKRVIFASSIAVYDPQVPEPVREEYAGRPSTLYGITKYLDELLGLWYHRKYGLEFIGLRFPVVFGPGRTGGVSAKYSSKMIEDAYRLGFIDQTLDLDAKVNYLFISDAVNALVKAIQIPYSTSKIYNICGFAYSIREFISYLKKYIPSLEVRRNVYMNVIAPAVYDITKAVKELQWKPTIDLERAIYIYLKCLSLKDPYCYLKEDT
jgi:nucleoside-diphosphate-sugar epimerase